MQTLKNFSLSSLAIGLLAFASTPLMAANPLEGTYVLETRELPDGKVFRSPEIVGMMTFTPTHRNLNVLWSEGGKPCSVSLIATYALTETDYAEATLFYADNLDGKGVRYDTSGAKGSAPVTRKDGSLSFDFPLHGEPSAVINADGTFVATHAGKFVDRWKKVR